MPGNHARGCGCCSPPNRSWPACSTRCCCRRRGPAVRANCMSPPRAPRQTGSPDCCAVGRPARGARLAGRGTRTGPGHRVAARARHHRAGRAWQRPAGARPRRAAYPCAAGAGSGADRSGRRLHAAAGRTRRTHRHQRACRACRARGWSCWIPPGRWPTPPPPMRPARCSCVARRAPGQVLFALRLRDGAGAERGRVPVLIAAVPSARVLLLAGAPQPELKYLRRWANDAGMQVRSQIAVGPGVQLGEGAALDAASLDVLDLLVIDQRRLVALGNAQRQGVRAAIGRGLGVLVRTDGPLDAAARAAPRRAGPGRDRRQHRRRGRRAALTGIARRHRRSRSAGRRRATAAPATPHPAAATGRCRDRRTRRRRQRIGLVAAARPRPHRHRPDRRQFCPGPGRPQRPACRAVGAAGERCRPRGRQRAGCGADWLVAATHDAVRRRRRRRRRRPYGYAPGAADRSGQRHRACAAYWPAAAGWHRLQTGTEQRWLYVRAPGDAPALHTQQTRDATVAMATVDAPASVGAPTAQPGARWPWLLAWLTLAAALWWLERRRR